MSYNPFTPLYFQPSFEFGKELVVDCFAGGGGASTGIEMALGVSPDIAINHNEESVLLHMANHKYTNHYISDIFEVNPLIVSMGRPVGYAHFSPDCTHHSKARGGKPKDKKIRALAWVVLKWATTVRQRVFTLENVEEFQDWGPLDNKGYAIESRKGETFNAFILALTTGLHKTHPAFKEIMEYVGEEYKEQIINGLGYTIDYKELKACDFGAPTIRKRFFMVGRCDGQPIKWPEPTHGDANSVEVKSGKLKPYRSASEIIDWGLPTYSIFMSKEEGKKHGVRRPLSDKTMERIGKGFKKFVLENPEPYIVKNMNNNTPRLVSDPLSTILTGNHHYLTVPYMAKHYTGATGFKLDEPMHTVTTQDHHSIIVPYIHRQNRTPLGHDCNKPLGTITAVNKYALTVPYFSQNPIHSKVVSSFLTKYYGQGIGQSSDTPLHTVPTKDRFGLVEIKGNEYYLDDIGFRMLTPRELYNAQGFPKDYIIDITLPNGKPLSKASQVRMCGNSVVPCVIEALVKANYEIQIVESKVA